MTWLDWYVHSRASSVRALCASMGVKMTRTSDGSPNIIAAERTVGFFRLMLAYHRYGPTEARSRVGITSPSRFVRNGNRPRAGESIFALVRLAAPVGRHGREPKADNSAGWVLNVRQEVAGHFKLQPYGPQQSLRRLIWVDGYERGPDDAPTKARAFVV